MKHEYGAASSYRDARTKNIQTLVWPRLQYLKKNHRNNIRTSELTHTL